MPTRTSIERENIVEASLELIAKGGWESVSARSIAARLGSSTMPIYTAIGSMEQLRRAAFVAAAIQLSAAQRQSRTGNPALDLAVGYVVFAKEQPRLFRFILENQKDIGDAVNAAVSDPRAPGSIADIEVIGQALGSIARPESRDDFVLRTWIFTNGLADLIAGGALVMDEAEITRHLQAAGGAFYLYAQNKEERA